jgi:hypothetical protein
MSIEPAVPTPLRWSEVPITFSRADQWTSFSEAGRFPLVLKPVVAVSKLNKVLIDGGSGLNVLFTKNLKKMNLDITHMLTKSTSPFYGIVPGNAAIPLGSVVLPVTFGESRDNYRIEYIKFAVADFEMSYHAILGRPAIAKFMVVPHYTVTEPLKLIPYYCLNHSSWPLSNNIEVTCRLCRVGPGKSLTSQDRHLYNKLTRRRVQR